MTHNPYDTYQDPKTLAPREYLKRFYLTCAWQPLWSCDQIFLFSVNMDRNTLLLKMHNYMTIPFFKERGK